MGLSIVFTEGGKVTNGPFQLASANGWKLVGEWVAALPGDDYGDLKSLADTGHSANTLALSAELTQALRLRPPVDPDVADTAGQLLDLIGVGASDEGAVVLNEHGEQHGGMDLPEGED